MSRGARRRALLAALCCSTAALGQVNTGVSDERVTLPQAPGSVSGVGENASVDDNHGALQYAIAIEVPQGFAGLTPELSLSYASNSGASVAGIGWSLPSFAIERMTSKGLQRYALGDRFVADGATELVQVDAAQGVYRARFERGFVRYSWLARGAGAGGYWKAELPDGRVAFYGADAAGAAVPTAQVQVPSTANVFAWHLVTVVDPFGHAMRLTWSKDPGGTPLLDRIEYLYEGALPRHSVRLTYEPRADVLSDGRPGFELQLTQRLRDVRVFSGTTAPEEVRRYTLEYEAPATSGGVTRLAAVSRTGRGGAVFPVRHAFGYSKTLGGTCASDCQKPFVQSMGTVTGVDFSQGRASLVDIDGDALPDVLVSSPTGVHQFFRASLDGEGRARFAATPVASARTVGGSEFILGDPKVQLLDVDGDGFVDLTHAKQRTVLCNDGSGDWAPASSCTQTSMGVPLAYDPEDDAAEAVQQDPRFVRFFDYDNDKRIDWLRTFPGGASTEVMVSSSAGWSSVAVDPIGLAFDESALQLADLNGDGLQDPVELTSPSAGVVELRFKLNLGFGRWSPAWRSVTLSGFNATQANAAELEDLDGDGRADVVAVTTNDVAFSLNRGGGVFSAPLTVASGDLSAGTIPTRVPGTTVSYADMNGNGSADVVWFQPNSAVSYLELFPVRPNLVARIENGLGAVETFSYGTSIVEQGRDAAAGKPWPNRVPHASVLVTRVDRWVSLTGSESGGLHEVVSHRYHAGYYDGVEKQFRGYERVEQERPAGAEDAEEPSLTVLEFDVGKTDPAFAGRVKKRSLFSLASSSPALVTEERELFATCPLDQAPGSTFVCSRASTTVLVEKDDASALTLEVQREYDGFGDVTRESDLGVKHLGTPEAPRACAACTASGVFGRPCGDACSSDEAYTETTYVVPATGGRWLLGRASRTLFGAVANSLPVETQTFYDGPEFVGLAAGQLTRGAVTRVSRRRGAGATDFVDVVRHSLDAHGNVAVALQPTAAVAGAAGRSLYAYDAAGLHVVSVEAVVNATRSLRRELQHETAFEQTSESSSWTAVVSGQTVSPPQVTRYRYDDHGRLAKVLEPGDGDSTPSTEYQYELADPASRIVTLRRSSATSGQDLVTAACYDGRGRWVQTRQRLTATQWQVSGFVERDRRGAAVKTYQPYRSASGSCERAAPPGVAFLRTRFDTQGRLLSELEPGGAERRHAYAPLQQRFFDEDATTPVVETHDGLGRLVALERTSPSAVTTLEYDAQGSLAAVKDPEGHAQTQAYDAMGRLTRVSSVNAGATTREVDAAGEETLHTDARGVKVRTEYDALGRTAARWSDADEAGTKVRWSYDVATGCAECTNTGGRLAQLDFTLDGESATERFGYDARGNVAFHERSVGGKALAVRFRYDAADRLAATLYPAGLTVTRTYDGASRVASLPGYAGEIAYDDHGQLERLVLTNGVTTTYRYDERLRLAGLKTSGPGASPLLDLGFTRSGRGALSSITDPSQRHGAKLEYDGWNRLKHAELDRESGDAEVLDYAYDTLDDVRSVTSSLGAASKAHAGTLSYDAARVNAVASAGDTAYAYDAAGQLSRRGGLELTFDHLGRLSSASRDGAELARFGFGAGPAPALAQHGDFRTRYESDDFEVRDGIAVVYVRLGRQRVARLESDATAASLLKDLAPAGGNGTIDVADAWLAQSGAAPAEVGALLASAARRLLLRDVTWLHEDHQSSVVAATDGDGAVLAEQSFYPTGARRSGSSHVDDYGFTGQRADAATGLVHFRYRALDPLTGRWVSPDPAFAALSEDSVRKLGEATTAYAYVANDFSNAVDPTGLGLFSAVRSLFQRSTAPRTRAPNRNLYAARLNARHPPQAAQAPQALQAAAPQRIQRSAVGGATLDRIDETGIHMTSKVFGAIVVRPGRVGAPASSEYAPTPAAVPNAYGRTAAPAPAPPPATYANAQPVTAPAAPATYANAQSVTAPVAPATYANAQPLVYANSQPVTGGQAP